MRPRFYTIIEDCVDRGARAGYQRAHKHDDDPGESEITQHIIDEIMGELTLRFDFSDSL
jgi:hypothetical protein